ncbi:MAG TPA: 50S ribosomal protein L25 [Oligoflexia bacterium]|nr:50S ribosomal protein L25 [Oligoflexia bacterium]
MDPVDLEISLRDQTGAATSRRVRRDGLLPGVVYKPGQDSIDVLLNTHLFTLAARGKAPTQLFRFKGGEDLDGKLSLIKNVQTEPLKGRVLHVEFLSVDESQRVRLKVAVKLTGTPECVRLNTASVNQTAYEIEMEVNAANIPPQIVVDISGMEAGESITAGDLPLPEGAILKSRKGLTIVSALVDKRAANASADAVVEKKK